MDQYTTKETNLGTEQTMLQEYSSQDQEEQIISRSNAEAPFSPPFLIFNLEIQRAFDLSDKETLIFAFIHYYTQSNIKKFFFSNQRLADIFNCSSKTVTTCLKNLQEKGLLEIHRKIMPNGGQMRYVNPTRKNFPSVPGSTRKNFQGVGKNLPRIKNELINNKVLERIKILQSIGQPLSKDIVEYLESSPKLKKQYSHLLP